MALQHIDDFERVGFVAKKDDVAAIGEATYVRPQFRPPTAQRTGQRGELSALPLQTIDERARNGAIPAFSGEISKYVPEILPRRR